MVGSCQIGIGGVDEYNLIHYTWQIESDHVNKKS